MLGLALLYAVVLFYASTVISPSGFTYKPADPWVQLARLRQVIAFGWVQNGSDQRADWTANLTALIPLGLLLAGALRVARPRLIRLLLGVLALAICVTYVLAVKYTQLWFPRTVTLNYITAQSLGALIGVSLALFAERPLATVCAAFTRTDVAALRILLLLLSLGILAFTLEPFDIALSPGDLASRVPVLRQSLFVLPFEGHSAPMRVLLAVTGGLLAAPFGAFLALSCTKAGHTDWPKLIRTGGVVLLATWSITLLILSATPLLFTLPSRMLGLLAGALGVRMLRAWHLTLLRRIAGHWAMIPLYLLAACAVKGLFAPGWQSFDAAWASIDGRYFLPLWTHYIVTKADAAKSVAVHAALFAPIGVCLWASAPPGAISRGRQLVAVIAAMLIAAGLEFGRWMKPGLAPDINNIAEAALVAWLALMLMPRIWAMLQNLVEPAA